ncbi:MAG: DUF805 domain-containing protein [bacterium]|nr:DUF805 domain-containing protein [bacterium]
MNWYVEVLKKYAVFSGRAHRTEYWMFVLFNFIISFVLGFVDGLTGMMISAEGGVGLLGTLYGLAVLVPSIAVAVRRLHDTGRSGWWYLLVLTCIGIIPLIIFLCMDSQPGSNQYGPNPKGA